MDFKLNAESSYNDLRNIIIYKSIQKVNPAYLRKALPDYINDELSWLDIIEQIPEIKKTYKLGAKERDGKIPFLKTFFAEVYLKGHSYSAESFFSEKQAMIELFFKIIEDTE